MKTQFVNPIENSIKEPSKFKKAYCQIMDCLFNADLMNGGWGENLRKNNKIKDLYE